MHACKSMVMMFFVAVAGSAGACAVDKPTDASDTDVSADTVKTTGNATDVTDFAGFEGPRSTTPGGRGTTNANGAGQCCWGHCTSSGAFEFPFLTDGCRAAVVNHCHNDLHQNFDPNGDAWWGSC